MKLIIDHHFTETTEIRSDYKLALHQGCLYITETKAWAWNEQLTPWELVCPNILLLGFLHNMHSFEIFSPYSQYPKRDWHCEPAKVRSRAKEWAKVRVTVWPKSKLMNWRLTPDSPKRKSWHGMKSSRKTSLKALSQSRHLCVSNTQSSVIIRESGVLMHNFIIEVHFTRIYKIIIVYELFLALYSQMFPKGDAREFALHIFR